MSDVQRWVFSLDAKREAYDGHDSRIKYVTYDDHVAAVAEVEARHNDQLELLHGVIRFEQERCEREHAQGRTEGVQVTGRMYTQQENLRPCPGFPYLMADDESTQDPLCTEPHYDGMQPCFMCAGLRQARVEGIQTRGKEGNRG